MGVNRVRAAEGFFWGGVGYVRRVCETEVVGRKENSRPEREGAEGLALLFPPWVLTGPNIVLGERHSVRVGLRVGVGEVMALESERRGLSWAGRCLGVLRTDVGRRVMIEGPIPDSSVLSVPTRSVGVELSTTGP